MPIGRLTATRFLAPTAEQGAFGDGISTNERRAHAAGARCGTAGGREQSVISEVLGEGPAAQYV